MANIVVNIPILIGKTLLLLVKIILAIVNFIVDPLVRIVAGAFLGLGKGLSGLFGMGLRSFAVKLIRKVPV